MSWTPALYPSILGWSRAAVLTLIQPQRVVLMIQLNISPSVSLSRFIESWSHFFVGSAVALSRWVCCSVGWRSSVELEHLGLCAKHVEQLIKLRGRVTLCLIFFDVMGIIYNCLKHHMMRFQVFFTSCVDKILKVSNTKRYSLSKLRLDHVLHASTSRCGEICITPPKRDERRRSYYSILETLCVVVNEKLLCLGSKRGHD